MLCWASPLFSLKKLCVCVHVCVYVCMHTHVHVGMYEARSQSQVLFLRNCLTPVLIYMYLFIGAPVYVCGWAYACVFWGSMCMCLCPSGAREEYLGVLLCYSPP